MDIEKELRRRWRRLWKEIGVHDHERELEAALRELLKLYTSKGRHYHTLEHILASLQELDKVLRFADDVDALELAIFYHDAIYDPLARNNEEESARLMQRHTAILPMPESLRLSCESLILATKHPKGIMRVGADERLISDIDLVILGSAPHVYDVYARNIRQEYLHLEARVYAQGRAAILEKFLAHQCTDGAYIFYLRRFRTRYEHRARQNLSRELAKLQATL